MSEADTMRSVIAQVMQNAESYHDIRISESRVIPKRLRVADNESSLSAWVRLAEAIQARLTSLSIHRLGKELNWQRTCCVAR
jgi:hypothetical protein